MQERARAERSDHSDRSRLSLKWPLYSPTHGLRTGELHCSHDNPAIDIMGTGNVLFVLLVILGAYPTPLVLSTLLRTVHSVIVEH